MRNTRHAAPAFTLIEIMIVVALIGLIMATGIPKFRGAIRREGLVKAVMDIKEACGTARRMAILDNSPMELRFTPRNGHFQVSAMARDIVAGSPPPVTAAVQPAQQPSYTVQPVQMPSIGGEDRPNTTTSGQISDSVRIEMLDVNFVEYKDAEFTRVRFYPNGTCDEMTLILHSDTGEWKKITLEAVTALADVDEVVQ